MKNTYNLAYRGFKWNSNKKLSSNINQFIFYYFVSSDIYFQALVKRYESVLNFYEYFLNLDENSMIIVGGKDSIIDPYSLKLHCEKNWEKCKLHYFDNEIHGFIYHTNNSDRIKTLIEDFIK